MSSKATYTYLGKSGLRVSVPTVGGMSYGSSSWIPWVLPEEQALPILKEAWDNGLNTIDTANMYSNGESERVIGKFIKKYEIPREQVVIISKARWIVAHNHPSAITGFGEPQVFNLQEYVNTGGLSRRALFNQVQGSLERLQTDYLDVLIIHSSDPNVSNEETMKALHDLVQSGKVHYIGASNIHLWEFAELQSVAERNGWTTFSCVQVEHSLIYRPEELEMFKYCNLKGIGLLAYSPLMDGYLARPIGEETDRSKRFVGTIYEKKRRESDNEIIRRVEEVAKKRQWKMSQVALAWSATKVSSPVVGLNSVQRVHDAIVGDQKLTEEELKYLEEPYEFLWYRY